MKTCILTLLLLFSVSVGSQEIGLNISRGEMTGKFKNPIGFEVQGHYIFKQYFSLTSEIGFRYFYFHSVEVDSGPGGLVLQRTTTELRSAYYFGITQYFSPFPKLNHFNVSIGIGEAINGFIVPVLLAGNKVALADRCRFELALPLRLEYPKGADIPWAFNFSIIPSRIFESKSYLAIEPELGKTINMIRLQLGVIFRIGAG